MRMRRARIVDQDAGGEPVHSCSEVVPGGRLFDQWRLQSGRRGSNPRSLLGRQVHCHCATPACLGSYASHIGPNAMAVRTNDIAFGELAEKGRDLHAPRHDAEHRDLVSGVAMI